MLPRLFLYLTLPSFFFRYTAARARVKKRLAQYQRDSPYDPADPSSKRNLKVQTEQWLEEIKDRTPEVEVAVQTEESGDILVRDSTTF